MNLIGIYASTKNIFIFDKKTKKKFQNNTHSIKFNNNYGTYLFYKI